MSVRQKCFEQAGLAWREAKVLCFFFEQEIATAREIERATALRQPEVSGVVTKFERDGWLKCEDIPRNGKGRPEKSYTVIGKKEIIGGLIKKLSNSIKQTSEVIEKLREYER